MGLLDDHLSFDPSLFQAGGGLYGRLASLQPQLSFDQPAQGSPFPPVPAGVSPSAPGNSSGAVPQNGAVTSEPSQPASGYMRIGDYWMPQFGYPEPASPPAAPTFGDRLSAGFQSWARTPLGNPFAGLANGISGFSAGRPLIDPNDRPDAERLGGQSGAMPGPMPGRRPAINLKNRRGPNNG